MITDRDKQIIQAVSEKERDFKELYEMFFPGISEQFARARLKILVDRGHLKRRKGPDDPYFIYYKEDI
jgi:DNA-binding HxlR family transcriptional regulator